jgi:hypothetical protein
MICKLTPWTAATLLLPSIACAEDGVSAGQFTANNLWMMMAAALASE